MENKSFKLWLIWIIGIVITLSTVFYQRFTGPTYAKRLSFSFQGYEYKLKIPRSFGGESDCPINLIVQDTTVTALLEYKRYNLNEEITEQKFERRGDTLKALLPHQPPAGKLEYAIIFIGNNSTKQITGSEMIVIRFKGEVPIFYLVVHILFIFAGMLLSNVTGLMALFKQKVYLQLSFYTVITLFLGGLLFGPIVQKYAFGVYWSGFPFGTDLTDNKLLIAFIFWLTAWWFNRKKTRYYLIIIAAIVLIATYAIPHSIMGSEYDYESGKVGTSKELRL